MRSHGCLTRLLLISVSVALPGGEAGFARELVESPIAHRNDAAKDWSPQELVKRYRKSVDSIRTLQAEMCVVTGRRFLGAPEGLKRDDSGRVIAYEAKRDWEASTQRYRLERSRLTLIQGIAVYTPLVAASDGSRYQGYNSDPKALTHLGGLIAPGPEKIRGDSWDYYWIPDLLGYSFTPAPDRSMWEILEGAKVVELEGTPPHLVVLETNYKFFGDHNETRLRAWIDTSHGCLPARVETMRLWSGTIAERFEVEEFHEAAPDLWVPVQGTIDRFFIDMVLPEGLTKEHVSRLATDELRALGVVYVAKPLGGESGFFPDRLIVDKDTLRVNEAIPRERFLLKFPEGMHVLDTTHEPPLRYQIKAGR